MEVLYMNKKIKTLTFVGVLVAVAVILENVSSIIPILSMPQGGHITFSLIPLFVISWKKGLYYGILGGVLVGLLQLGMYISHPVQFLLDYPIAFASFGISGVLLYYFKKASLPFKYLLLNINIVIACGLRFICHYFSGYFFFASSGWVNVVYNGGYMLATLVVSLIVVNLIFKRLNAYFDPIESNTTHPSKELAN
jgi:thiamine transporter